MATSQNGYPAPPRTFRKWIVPGAGRHFTLTDGPAGFILVHLALWFHQRVERLNAAGSPWDEWAYAFRVVRAGQTLSNHASGTAIDVNATRHPLGVRGTMGAAVTYVRIRARLAFYRGCIRWGGDYTIRADEMHYEVNKGYRPVRRLAARLARTPRGVRILEANPNAVRALDMTPRETRRFLLYITKRPTLARRAIALLTEVGTP
jgi:hypothetical protein